MKVSFFDIGTNSIHMKIVELHDERSFEVLEHLKDMTRIGAGSFSSHRLSKRSMKRALKVLSEFSNYAKDNDVRTSVVIATSAVRDAENSRNFLKALKKKTGLTARIVSGVEEGRLIFLGACSGSELVGGKILSLDIGGGSAEFVLADSKKIDFAESFHLGVARLKDRFISKNPPSKSDLRSLEHHIEEMLNSTVAALRKKKFVKIVGTGGTLINLASMVYEAREGRNLSLRGYYELKRKDLQKLYRRISKMSAGQLRKLEGVEKKRADLMITGCLLVLTIMKRLQAERIFVCDKGIREGMILDYLMKKKMKMKTIPPCVRVQWFGQKPYFSGHILHGKAD